MNNVLLFTFGSELVNELKQHLPQLKVFDTSISKNALSTIRRQSIECNIFNLRHIKIGFLKEVKSNFLHIPAIAILPDSNLEIARTCGTMGIEMILHIDNLHSINEYLYRLSSSSVKPTLRDFNIDVTRCSVLTQRALEILEADFVGLFSTQEIADRLKVSHITLCRIFNQHKLISPKQLLMAFKVRYASLLMRNRGYNLTEVATLSGFTSTKRMCECFKRVYDSSPSHYREFSDICSVGEKSRLLTMMPDANRS